MQTDRLTNQVLQPLLRMRARGLITMDIPVVQACQLDLQDQGDLPYPADDIRSLNITTTHKRLFLSNVLQDVLASLTFIPGIPFLPGSPESPLGPNIPLGPYISRRDSTYIVTSLRYPKGTYNWTNHSFLSF